MTKTLSKKGAIADYLSFIVLVIALFIIFFFAYRFAEPFFEKRQVEKITSTFEDNNQDYILFTLLKTNNLAEKLILYPITTEQTTKIETELLLNQIFPNKPSTITINDLPLTSNKKGDQEPTQVSTIYLPSPLGSINKVTQAQLLIYKNE